MIKDPYFENYELENKRRNMIDTGLNNEELKRYGFRSISFLHVLLAKLFFLPIVILLLLCFFTISLIVKIIIKKEFTTKVYNIAFYCLFFNIPI
jgi:hypothetical protein